MDRVIVLTIKEQEKRFLGEVVWQVSGKVSVKASVSFSTLQLLLLWAAERHEFAVFVNLELEEVVIGEVDPGSTDWLTDVLGVKVTQPALFWYQTKETEGKRQIAVIRKAVLEEKLKKLTLLEERLIGFSIFKNASGYKFLVEKNISLPEQIISKRVALNRSKWISRLAGVVSCCCLIASLCLFALTHNLQLQSAHKQQQVAAFLPQLDSIQENKATIDRLSHHLQQIRQLQPSAYSYFADRIASIAPANLSFQQLIFSPDLRERKRISPQLKNDSLDFILTGHSADALAITTFSNEMQKLDCVTSIQLLETPFDREEALYDFKMKGRVERREAGQENEEMRK